MILSYIFLLHAVLTPQKKKERKKEIKKERKKKETGHLWFNFTYSHPFLNDGIVIGYCS